MHKGNLSDLDYIMLEEDMKYLEDKYRTLIKDKGVLLLDHMDEDRLIRVLSLLKEFHDVKGFTVLDGKDKRLVLRYYNRDEDVNTDALSDEAFGLYKEKDYPGAIEKYKTVLENSLYTRAHIYDMIGKCYLKIGDDSKAIDYLTIATYTSSKENTRKKIDHSKLISELLNRKVNLTANKQDVFNNKDYFYHKEFAHNESYNYGINNIDAIKDYAAINGISIEEAGSILGLSTEQRDLLKLVIARDLYKQGMLEEGNRFLNAVDGTKNKTPLVRYFMNEVREKKKFYQYRGDKPKTLVKLNPGKRI